MVDNFRLFEDKIHALEKWISEYPERFETSVKGESGYDIRVNKTFKLQVAIEDEWVPFLSVKRAIQLRVLDDLPRLIKMMPVTRELRKQLAIETMEKLDNVFEQITGSRYESPERPSESNEASN